MPFSLTGVFERKGVQILRACCQATDFIFRDSWSSFDSVITYDKVEIEIGVGCLNARTGVYTVEAAGLLLLL